MVAGGDRWWSGSGLRLTAEAGLAGVPAVLERLVGQSQAHEAGRTAPHRCPPGDEPPVMNPP